MGLCKCPKKKVTNQFCFEHRVNVCEHCMVTNHPKCIVQSYLHWLMDSDCNPICILCNESLRNADCIRLMCYHVFHWSCLDAFARNLPATTAPSGYSCPTCQTHIFPNPKLVSPVADVLREKLAGVSWARAGLGLPLLSDDREQKPNQDSKTTTIDNASYQNHVTPSHAPSVATSRIPSAVNSQGAGSSSPSVSSQKLGPPYSVVNVESNMAIGTPMARKVFESFDDPKDITFDHDENKYKRKSATEWFTRWWKVITRAPPRRRHTSGSLYKRYVILGAIGIVVFVLTIILFSWLGRMATDGDPSFNILSNPNINVEREAPV